MSRTLDDVAPRGPADIESIIAAARAERLDAVLAHTLSKTRSRHVWPADAMATLGGRSRQHLVLESMRWREVVQLMDAFANDAIDVLLLKGAGLAYTVYPAPHLRPRDDTDLFIRRDDLDRAARALSAAGYARLLEADVELACTQRRYAKVDASGWRHVVDLHWRVAIPRLFANTLAFEEVWLRSIDVPAITPAARTLGFADALLLACVHRVAHHDDALDLLWLWDIHLLASRITAELRSTFSATAARAGMCDVCLRSLTLARQCFGTEIGAISAAIAAARTTDEEPSAKFIGGLRRLDALKTDLHALQGWSERLQLLREHLFPPPAHMRATCGPRAFLPFAYLRRIVRGAPSWFRRPGGT